MLAGRTRKHHDRRLEGLFFPALLGSGRSPTPAATRLAWPAVAETFIGEEREPVAHGANSLNRALRELTAARWISLSHGFPAEWIPRSAAAMKQAELLAV